MDLSSAQTGRHARPPQRLPTVSGGGYPDAARHTVCGVFKQRLYGLDARGLRPVHEWVGGFERFWNESFDRLDTYVQGLKQTRQED